jgi:hypothetical protein
MSIKNFKPPTNSKYVTGDFSKYNPKKYTGDRPIYYRSSYELRFMIIVELNPKVIKWSSEQIVIPYFMQEKLPNGKKILRKHNYNSDFTIWLDTGEIYIIEVKPYNKSPQNNAQIKRDPDVYKNACKWKAALQFAKLKGYQFKVVNEKHLKTRIF